MSDEDLVELCYGECAACCFDEPHAMVTREVLDRAISNYMDYLRRRDTPEYEAEQEEERRKFMEEIEKMKRELDKKNEH
jgi:glycerol-3-phosphate O-acyltransferase